MSLEEILEVLFIKLKEISKSETVVGQPMHLGDSFVVPISRLKIGFMVGTGAKTERNMGATGGAVSIDPIAMLVVGPDGKSYLMSVARSLPSAIDKAVDILPDIISKIVGKKEEEKTKIESLEPSQKGKK